LQENELRDLRALFTAHSVSEEETDATIRNFYETTGVLIDPHTAVAIAAAKLEVGDSETPMVVLSTAHPAKFPEAVSRATGTIPEQPERCEIMPNDSARVTEFISATARASTGVGA
jgi:threonine synthase